jgi:hypothetical protein
MERGESFNQATIQGIGNLADPQCWAGMAVCKEGQGRSARPFSSDRDHIHPGHELAIAG